MTQVVEGTLQVYRQGIVQRGIDASLFQFAQYRVATCQAYHVQVPDVLVSGKSDRQRNSIKPREQLVIMPCRLPSRLVPSRQTFQLCAEHYRLYRIEPRVEAHARVMMV